MERFSTEEVACEWFENLRWGKSGRYCPKCGSTNTHEAKHAKCPYRCRDCKKYFSIKTGSATEGSKVPTRKWIIVMYLDLTSLKGVSSNKLSRDIGVQQRTAWFMLHCIREGFIDQLPPMNGPVEVDETYIGGRRRNMGNRKRKEPAGTGRGGAGKAAVVGVKDRGTKQVRAKVVDGTDRETLYGFIRGRVNDGAKVYTDEASAYQGMPFDHEAIKHSVGKYVRDMAHTTASRVVLVDAQARIHRDLPLDEREAPAALRQRVCGSALHARAAHRRATAGSGLRSGRKAPELRETGQPLVLGDHHAT